MLSLAALLGAMGAWAADAPGPALVGGARSSLGTGDTGQSRWHGAAERVDTARSTPAADRGHTDSWPALTGVFVANPILGPAEPDGWSEVQLLDEGVIRIVNTTIDEPSPAACASGCRATVGAWRHEVPLPASEETLLVGPRTIDLAGVSMLPFHSSEGWLFQYTQGYDEEELWEFWACEGASGDLLHCTRIPGGLSGPTTRATEEGTESLLPLWWTRYDALDSVPTLTVKQALEQYLLAGQGN